MTENFSKTQIDRLGNRIKKDPLTESDLRLLDDYRRSFGEAYETTVRINREQLRLEPTGRPAKSTGAIIEKLRRESIRLSQVQDIAGCRIIVADIAEQERVAVSLRTAFPEVSVIDRRETPSYGYRAVHVIALTSRKLIEIQVRTSLQHLWAELSEKLSDVYDPNIKYGGGEESIRLFLTSASEVLVALETEEKKLHEQLETTIINSKEQLTEYKKQLTEAWTNVLSALEKRKEQKQ